MNKKFVLFLIFLLLNSSSFSQVFDWEWQNSKPTGNDLRAAIIHPSGQWMLFGNAGTMLKSNDNGLTWSLSYPDSILKRDIYEATFVNANLGFLCGFNGLIMKTTDAGLTWVEKPSGTTANLWYIDFINADTGYAAGSSATVVKTTNGGETWSAASFGTANINKIYFLNSLLGFAGSSNSTFGYLTKTTDGGATWAKVATYPGASGVYGICFTDANTGFITDAAYAIYRTTDAGTSWTQIGDYGSGTFYEIKFFDANNGVTCGSRGEVYKTTNAGVTWTKTQNPFNTSFYGMAIGTSGGNRIITVGNGGVISTSPDFGTTWNMLSSSPSLQLLREIYFVNQNTGYAVGGSAVTADTLGDILKTMNGGSTWTKLPFNPKTRVYSQCWLDENTGWIGTVGPTGIYKTLDGGTTFTQLNTNLGTASNTWYEIKFADAATGYACGAAGNFVKTTNGGDSWTTIVTPIGTSIIYAIHMFSATDLVLVGASGKACRTTDGGATWITFTGTGTSSLYGVSFVNTNVGYICGSSGSVFKTTDGGTTFTQLTTGITSTLYTIRFDTETRGWFGGATASVYYTMDGGAAWTRMKPFLSTNKTVYDIAIKQGYLWITGDDGLIIRGFSDPTIPVELVSFSASVSDGKVNLNWNTATETNNAGFSIERKSQSGNMWETVSFIKGNGNTTEMHSYRYTDSPLSGMKYQYRLKQIDFNGSYTYSNIVEVNLEAPENFLLEQNYPNPFNPETVIGYQLSVDSHQSVVRVSLKVYDMLGREVAELVNADQQPGKYSVTFNASDLSSGIYIVTMKAGSFVQSRKITLLK